MKAIKNLLPSLIALILFLLFWELLVNTFKVLDPSLYSSPIAIISVFLESPQSLIRALGETALAAGLGWLVSIIIGISMGLLLHLIPMARRALFPYAVFFQTLPIIAVAPLLVIHFGFGIITTIASAIIVSIFPIIASTVVGLSQVPTQKSEIFKIYKATATQKLFYLELPYGLSYLFAGVKTACGLAIIGTITGEFIVGGGLGGYIDVAQTQQKVDLIFAALILLVGLGIAYNFILFLVQKIVQKLIPYHYTNLN